MTLAQLQAAAPLLNLSALARAAGLSSGYLRNYLCRGEEMPIETRAAVDRALIAAGLLTPAERAPMVQIPDVTDDPPGPQ